MKNNTTPQEKLEDIYRQMCNLSHEMLMLEAEYCKLYTRSIPDFPPPLKYATGVLDGRREDLEKEENLRRMRTLFQRAVALCKEDGRDPQEVYPHWEFQNGEPTGRFKEISHGEEST